MTDVLGFMDASCPKCKRRFGWSGRVVDRPPCPRCGHKPSPADLERDQAAMNDFRTMLVELREANPNWEHWRKARVAAGLTLRQAAKMLGFTPTEVSAIESGQCKPSEEMALKMAELYGG